MLRSFTRKVRGFIMMRARHPRLLEPQLEGDVAARAETGDDELSAGRGLR